MDADVIRAKYQCEIAAACRRAEGAEFLIGEDDCAFWIDPIDFAVLGVHPAEPYMNKFYCARDRAAVLGWRDLPGAMMETARRMRWSKIVPVQAMPGDRGLTRPGEVWTAAIFDGLFWLVRVDCGIAGFPTRAVRRAWSPV